MLTKAEEDDYWRYPHRGPDFQLALKLDNQAQFDISLDSQAREEWFLAWRKIHDDEPFEETEVDYWE